ncbi:MAG: polysaccharide biosynthesis C-terminal domain-containing protein [Flavobacteriales bacterium]|jgi:O-antigen/teichoic acid export membrane protein|nr:polysaccharide biosynthesis C-terminal domain-containing protein [Flavobacteriales bacterium]
MNNVLRTFIKNTLVNRSLKVLLLRVGGVFLFFLLSLFLTNFFDPEIVGRYDFTRSTLLILGGICLLGTNQAIIYYSGVLVAQDSLGGLQRVYQKMVTIIVGTSLVFLVLVLLIPDSFFNSFFEKADASELVFKIVLALSAFAMTMLNIDTLRGLKRTLFSELYRNIFRYLPFFLGAILLFATQNAHWLVEVYLLGFVVLALVSTIQVVIAFHKSETPDRLINYSYNSIFKKSYPMALSAVSYFMMQSIDIILLGKFTDFDTVAFYSVAVKLATATSLALQSVNIIIAPKIAEVFKKQELESLNKMIKNSARLIFMLSLPALAVLALFATFFLGLFGSEYTVAKEALYILLLGQFFNTLCGPVAIYMNMTGKQHVLHQILIVGFATNLICNWFFIPEFGMIGAAWATALSMILWNVIAVLYTYKKDRIKTFIS